MLTGSTHKVALAYKHNDIQPVTNGVLGTADTSATMPMPTEFHLGHNGFGAGVSNIHIRQLKYYPRRLTNALLQEIST